MGEIGMTAIFVYITASSMDEANRIADAVVGERLAACANIIPGMTSIYHWKGKVERAQECALILKTRAELFGQLEARVKALHSYDTPCIVALPVTAGSAGYLGWVEEETRK
jgi:periplasmic divalent cation tolerance protein